MEIPGLLPMSVEARWCIAALDRKNGRSCLPGCSCSPPQKMESCMPGEEAVERTTGGVKLLVTHGKRRRGTEGPRESVVRGFQL